MKRNEMKPSTETPVVQKHVMGRCPSDKKVLIKLHNLLSIILQWIEKDIIRDAFFLPNRIVYHKFHTPCAVKRETVPTNKV